MEMTFEDGMQESMLPMFEMYADEDGCDRIASHKYGRKPYCKRHWEEKTE